MEPEGAAASPPKGCDARSKASTIIIVIIIIPRVFTSITGMTYVGQHSGDVP
jgi:hypothetical protein